MARRRAADLMDLFLYVVMVMVGAILGWMARGLFEGHGNDGE